MAQYQEIMLQENKAICEQLNELRTALQSKEQECDQSHIKVALQAKEIESLRLQVAELEDYRTRYEQQAQEVLQNKETEISELHTEMYTIAEENSTLMTQVN